MRSVLIKIGSNGFDHRTGQKRLQTKASSRARHKPYCDAEMPKIAGMKLDPAANHRASCGQARVGRRQHSGETDQDQQDVPKHHAEKEADHPGRGQLMIK